MADKATKSNTAPTSTTRDKKTASVEDLGQAEAQERMDEETSQGFFGAVPDPTPNENYTVKGVTSGKPTPETDARAAQKAREATGGPMTAVERNAAAEK